MSSPLNKIRAIAVASYPDRVKNDTPCTICKKIISPPPGSAASQAFYGGYHWESNQKVSGYKPDCWKIEVEVWGVPYDKETICLDCLDSFEYEVFVAGFADRVIRECTTMAKEGTEHLVKRLNNWISIEKVAAALKGGKNVVHWF